jgi:hypothetical protein
MQQQLFVLLLVHCSFLLAGSSEAHTSQSITPLIHFSPVSDQLIDTSFASFLESSADDVIGASSSAFPTLTEVPLVAQESVTVGEEKGSSNSTKRREAEFAEKTRVCEYLGWEAGAAAAALLAAQGNVTAALVALSLEHSRAEGGGRDSSSTPVSSTADTDTDSAGASVAIKTAPITIPIPVPAPVSRSPQHSGRSDGSVSNTVVTSGKSSSKHGSISSGSGSSIQVSSSTSGSYRGSSSNYLYLCNYNNTIHNIYFCIYIHTVHNSSSYIPSLSLSLPLLLPLLIWCMFRL